MGAHQKSKATHWKVGKYGKVRQHGKVCEGVEKCGRAWKSAGEHGKVLDITEKSQPPCQSGSDFWKRKPFPGLFTALRRQVFVEWSNPDLGSGRIPDCVVRFFWSGQIPIRGLGVDHSSIRGLGVDHASANPGSG